MKKKLLTFTVFLLSTQLLAQVNMGSGVGTTPSTNSPVGGFPGPTSPGMSNISPPLNSTTIDNSNNQFPSTIQEEQAEQDSNFGIGTGTGTGTNIGPSYLPGTGSGVGTPPAPAP